MFATPQGKGVFDRCACRVSPNLIILALWCAGFTDSPLVEVYKAVCVQRGVVPGNAVCLQLDHQVMAELLLPQAGMSACAVEALCEAISQQQLPLLRKWVLTGNSCSGWLACFFPHWLSRLGVGVPTSHSPLD